MFWVTTLIITREVEMQKTELLNKKVEYNDKGFETLSELCDFLPKDSRNDAVVGLLYTIGWF